MTLENKIESRLRALRMELEDCDEQIRSLEDRKSLLSLLVQELEGILGDQEDDDEGAPDEQNGAPSHQVRTSVAIVRLLQDQGPLNLGQIAMALQGKVKSEAANFRNTISTTLYNLKRAGKVVHDENLGIYSLAQ